MPVINIENVKEQFIELSGLDSSQAQVYDGLVTACVNEAEKALDSSRIADDSDREICEFAAAAEAFYRYICLLAAEEKIICTAQGSAVEKYSDEGRIKAAGELRDSAVSRAERFFGGDSFVFSSVISY